jgi:hypothetical protein
MDARMNDEGYEYSASHDHGRLLVHAGSSCFTFNDDR